MRAIGAGELISGKWAEVPLDPIKDGASLAAACWVEWYDQSFPGGQGDPAYLVLRFEAESGNYCLGGRSLDFVP